MQWDIGVPRELRRETMSSDCYGGIAGEIADEGADWPCCSHCDHDPGLRHAGQCITCFHNLPDYDRQ